MAVSANDFAFLHLTEKSRPASISDAICDTKGLAPDVVELKDEHIGFATINARVSA